MTIPEAEEVLDKQLATLEELDVELRGVQEATIAHKAALEQGTKDLNEIRPVAAKAKGQLETYASSKIHDEGETKVLTQLRDW